MEEEGVWTSAAEPETHLSTMSATQQLKYVKNQILAHKLILKTEVKDSKLFLWTVNAKKRSMLELKTKSCLPF